MSTAPLIVLNALTLRADSSPPATAMPPSMAGCNAPPPSPPTPPTADSCK